MTIKKIFISHQVHDKKIVEIFVDFLCNLGIASENIFCSIIPDCGVKFHIPEEVRVALENSVLDVIILSNSYKQSAYCLNEAGIIWFKKDCDNILIGLPEIMPNNMNSGFINNDCVLRRLDNLSDIRIIYELISNALKIKQADEILFNRESRNLQSKYKEILNNGEYYASNSYLNDTLFSEITTENDDMHP